MNGESTLLSSEVWFNLQGIFLFHSQPGRHCALVVCSIRTIKDRARSVLFYSSGQGWYYVQRCEDCTYKC